MRPLDSAKPIILLLDHGTEIRLTALGEGQDTRDGHHLPLSFVYVQRGRMSRWAIRKRLTRWLNNLLREDLAALGLSCSFRELARHARWNAKHIGRIG